MFAVCVCMHVYACVYVCCWIELCLTHVVRVRPAQSQSQALAVCGAEIDMDSSIQQGISCEIRKGWLASICICICGCFFSHAPYCAQWFASLAPEGRNGGWEGRAQVDGLVGPNGPKASLYPTGV